MSEESDPPQPPPPEAPSVLGNLAPDEMFARAAQSVKMTNSMGGTWQPPTVEETAAFPGYEVLKLLGRGGMGAVYQARQIELDRFVAIKLLPLEISVDQDFADRFRREARAMAKLNHPNIISVYDFGTTNEGHLCIVMEYVEGANLHDIIHQVGLNGDQALSVVEQVCTALAYAHSKGIVHRDIKPANVMIDTESHVKVADFGLARLTDSSTETVGHTMTGTVMGTPDYMAPEQMRGMNVDHRADIYSVGVMVYEMLCREVPRGAFEPPSVRGGCDPRIDPIVMKAMQPNPDRRYQSTQEMKADVVAARSGVGGSSTIALPTSGKSRLPLYGGLAAGLLALAVAGYVFLKPRSESPGKAPPSTAPHADAGPVFLPVVAGEANPARADAHPTTTTDPATAGKDAPLVNTLGMKFVPVPILGGPTGGKTVLFGVWDTRVQDYEIFVDETKRAWPTTDFPVAPTHPAVLVSWEDAQLFCQWLTAREQAAGQLPAGWTYRLPSDHEWSCAVELGAREDAAKLPEEKDRKIKDVFPWGSGWPPPAGAGNFAGEELQPALAEGKFKYVKSVMAGYNDGFVNTSPVGSFPANRFGLYDLGGNVQQWCEDWFDQEQKTHALRGSAWNLSDRDYQLSSRRFRYPPGYRSIDLGFRCVVAPAAPLSSVTAAPPPFMSSTPASATKAAPFVNTLGQQHAPAATPAPATEVEKWFAQVDGPEQEAFQKQVLKPYEAGVTDLRSRYRANLDAAIARASAAAQLAEALLWRSEKQTFEKTQNVAPDNADTPPKVQALRAAFRQQLATLDEGRTTQARALFTAYDAILAKYQTLLTQRQRLDDALLLKTKREALALAWLGPAPGIAGGSAPLPVATKDLPFVNTLGMKFVPVPGTKVLFSVWDTRVQDYAAYAHAHKVDEGWMQQQKNGVPVSRDPDHPVVGVNWDDVQGFCQWLTDREVTEGKIPKNAKYRLPTDEEWSRAVGLPPEQGATPAEKSAKNQTDFPWGTGYPPARANVGNYADATWHEKFPKDPWLEGYTDGSATTSPVGSFPANVYGLFDMGGNVWQWCEDWFDSDQKAHAQRGGAWNVSSRNSLLSSGRGSSNRGVRFANMGFRCVLELAR